MALPFTIDNIIQLFSLFSPLFLGTFLVLVSIFNQNIKGIIYLAGALFTSIICYGISNVIGNPKDPTEGAICNLIDLPWISNLYNVPNFNSVFISFTFIYLLLPMLINNQINVLILGVIASLFVIDAYVKINNRCTPGLRGIGYGLILGLAFGTAWFMIFKITDNEKFLFFNDLTSNNVVCNRPANQSFKCSVYKNGQIVSEL
jgi:hypothetical protein